MTRYTKSIFEILQLSSFRINVTNLIQYDHFEFHIYCAKYHGPLFGKKILNQKGNANRKGRKLHHKRTKGALKRIFLVYQYNKILPAQRVCIP